MMSQPGQRTITIHILPNISRSKVNQIMKFSQLIEYNKRNIFFKNHAENEAGMLVPDPFLFFRKASCEVKAIVLQLGFIVFQQPSTWHTIKTNCIKLQTTKMVWEQFFHHILCSIFQENCFLCYNLLTDQVSLPNCLYFLRYWAICVLELFGNQVLTSEVLKLTLSF